LYKQCGAALLLVVMILIVLSTMIFFNARITAYEQIISGNDRRSKLATHAAEAGISHAKRYFSRNIRALSLNTGGGWLPGGSGANLQWLACDGVDLDNLGVGDPDPHPCSFAPLAVDGRADSFVRENVFYYVEDADATTQNTYLPLQALVQDLTDADPSVAIDLYKVQALLCAIDYDQDNFDPSDATTLAKCSPTGIPSGLNVAIKVVSTGYADANVTASEGGAEAIITQILANVEPGGGPPVVPIMSYNEVAPGGTLSVVVSPNAGGIGVPVSIWSKNSVVITGGSVATCELEDYLADQTSDKWRTWTDAEGLQYNTCDSCTCPDSESQGALTHTQNIDPPRKYFDIVDNDPTYPDDIFEYYFGVARTEYQLVRDAADHILADCSTVDASMAGLVWVDGYCDLSGNEVGSAIAPVALVASKGVKLNGGTIMYGLLLISDPELPSAGQTLGDIPVDLSGGPVLYGALMFDPGAAALGGGFTIVYVQDILAKIHPLIILGMLPGSWSDQSTFN
jgi:hypothetical protein